MATASSERPPLPLRVSWALNAVNVSVSGRSSVDHCLKLETGFLRVVDEMNDAQKSLNDIPSKMFQIKDVKSSGWRLYQTDSIIRFAHKLTDAYR